MSTIRVIVDQIAHNFKPEKVNLIGSHAYGHPKSWSNEITQEWIDLAENDLLMAERALSDDVPI